MKLKNLAKKSIIFVWVFAVIIMSVFCAVALPEDETEQEPVVTEEAVVVETEAPVVETEPTTVAPVTEPITQAPETQPETEAPQTAAPETQAPTQASTQTTYSTTQAVTYSLPSAEVDTAPTAVTVTDDNESGDLTYGIASWVCVIVGILAVIIVLISNKTKSKGGNGRQRYDEGDRITGQKRLLNDDYYNKRKTQSYYNKDTRR